MFWGDWSSLKHEVYKLRSQEILSYKMVREVYNGPFEREREREREEIKHIIYGRPLCKNLNCFFT